MDVQLMMLVRLHEFKCMVIHFLNANILKVTEMIW